MNPEKFKHIKKSMTSCQVENQLRSWAGLLLSIILVISLFISVLIFDNILVKLGLSLFLGLSLLRIFSLYHEFNHSAILRKSRLASLLMKPIGFLLLSPTSLWNNYHDLHHKENSRFTLKIMGNFPTITLEEFNELNPNQKKQYLLKRNFWVILFGYFTVFIVSFCLNPFKDNPRKNYLGLIVVLSHALIYIVCLNYFGIINTFLLIFLPLSIFGFLGGVIFYLQHNCDGLKLFEKDNWTREKAAIYSSSFIKMNLFWRFFTANVGYHNVHHINSRIPFYNLPKAMEILDEEFPEITKVAFTFRSIIRSFRLKVYDTKDKSLVSI